MSWPGRFLSRAICVSFRARARPGDCKVLQAAPSCDINNRLGCWTSTPVSAVTSFQSELLLIFSFSSAHHRSLRQADGLDLVISQGKAQQKRPGLFEPKASFHGDAQRALEISQFPSHAGSNAGDVYKKMQRLVSFGLTIDSDRIWLCGKFFML